MNWESIESECLRACWWSLAKVIADASDYEAQDMGKFQLYAEFREWA